MMMCITLHFLVLFRQEAAGAVATCSPSPVQANATLVATSAAVHHDATCHATCASACTAAPPCTIPHRPRSVIRTHV